MHSKRIDIAIPDDVTQDEMQEWLRILNLATNNHALSARLLRITNATLYKWSNDDAPTQWWRREVMRSAVEIAVDHLRAAAANDARRRHVWAGRIKRVERALLELPADRYFVKAAARGGDAERVARGMLREVLAHGAVAYGDIEKAARRAGVNMTAVGRAAGALGVQRRRVGFGRGGYMEWRLTDAEEE